MDPVNARINFIEIALGSFEDYADETDRKSALKSKLVQFTSDVLLQDQLKAYVGMSKDRLEHSLEDLRQEKNLLLKQSRSSAGN